MRLRLLNYAVCNGKGNRNCAKVSLQDIFLLRVSKFHCFVNFVPEYTTKKCRR